MDAKEFRPRRHRPPWRQQGKAATSSGPFPASGLVLAWEPVRSSHPRDSDLPKPKPNGDPALDPLRRDQQVAGYRPIDTSGTKMYHPSNGLNHARPGQHVGDILLS
ncbi:hypothetical protein AVEN_92125-1 [Araneus ventricosus]|uniref:Uncharacterized protein n=1 Tax=Araneus ventricosus TaxID=182803 RepID=A0A4Y2WGH7_ARAVE|nr:hypothetical protein AVEN_92125-1 [Araneus ventricosus]